MNSSTSATFLLLNSLLPKNSVKLGRLVRRPLHPGEGYAPQTPSLPKNLLESSLEEDVKKVLVNDAKGTGFKAALTRLFQLDIDNHEIAVQVVGSRAVITRRFLNADIQLDKILASEETRKWLKMDIQVAAGVVYLVVGIKSFIDARVIQGYKEKKNLRLDAKLPISELASFLALPEMAILDTQVSAQRTSEHSTASSSLAAGEQVFAVEYRPLRLRKMKLEETAHLGRSTYGQASIQPKTAGMPTIQDRIDTGSGMFILGLDDGALQIELDEQDMDDMMLSDVLGPESIVSGYQPEDSSVYIYEEAP